MESDLKVQAQKLVELLESGDVSSAVNVIQELNEMRDQSLYQEVGRLTRALHESLMNFHIDSGITGKDQEEISHMADASDRLSYVTQMTESAANKTMDIVENCTPTAAELGVEAKALGLEWKRFINREISPDEFRVLSKKIGPFLEATEQRSTDLGNSLNDIIMAQDYQDLTGQVIKRVVSLVSEIEDSLVHLVRMAGKVDQMTGIEHEDMQKKPAVSSVEAEGPQINKEHREDVVSGQDEVDDLLSSLGF
ncbi:protein phosphatase CheZ [Aestuariirhabdus sp. Z084]|uniref:protein phosphatase CheZ n=1 Tax=Aestuariirhabdus haliotis TaxID=2918751 RepID=UPI00201B3C2D|nr:protein phosphatase CheZ [Aestuariirhabdus haliotis]MCL6414480.1 protein phosphatase CheZ [Aestuariirhabdus haliotis]MCL6418538.1 protein phosphatase CheZ [Aestuariirhabdus haliotis]